MPKFSLKNPLLIILLIVVAVGVFFGAKWMMARQSASTTQTANSAANGSNGQNADINYKVGTGPIVLSYAVHWQNESQHYGIYENGKLKTKGLRQYLEEYVKLHPEVSFEVKSTFVTKYHQNLQVLNSTDQAPDIYQIFSQWGAPFVASNMLDTPPQDIVADVQKNYISTQGVTVNNKIWGIPTEADDYLLLYNKKLFAAAGITTPPKTWSELVTDAVKTTKKSGNSFTQYGIAFLKDDHELIVDPFMGLLFSNNGQFVNADRSKTLVNSKEGVEVLDGEKELFTKGATDINANFYNFGDGTVAMIIAPPWVRAGFASKFGDQFEQTVGVAPLPYFKKPATLQYGWFMGVMNKSKHKKEAWDFLRWFSSDVQPGTNTTRYGDLLANTIGAIPSRKMDLQNEKALRDFFTQKYVNELSHSQTVPNLQNFEDMRTILRNEIQATWTGQKTSQQAMDSAATQINTILSQNKK